MANLTSARPDNGTISFDAMGTGPANILQPAEPATFRIVATRRHR